MVNESRFEINAKHRASYRLQAILSLKPAKAESQNWLIVYLDVITLLLATFILLVNQPQQQFKVEQPKIKQQQLQQAPVDNPVLEINDTESDQLAESETLSPDKQQNIADEIRKQIEMIEGEDLEVIIEPGSIRLQLPEAILFETGKSQLLPAADELLNSIAPIILQHNFPVSVEGHTDNVPIASPQFPSNWELSSARASVVIRKLGELGVAYSRLKAIGYADTKPIDSNQTEQGRKRNRRVNIIIQASNSQ